MDILTSSMNIAGLEFLKRLKFRKLKIVYRWKFVMVVVLWKCEEPSARRLVVMKLINQQTELTVIRIHLPRWSLNEDGQTLIKRAVEYFY